MVIIQETSDPLEALRKLARELSQKAMADAMITVEINFERKK